ncbi:MAG: D-alanine--D-alanine ligase family protein [Solirubrobacterales bacterium]
MNKRLTVAVLSGGRSSEHEISLLSGKAVAAGLSEAGFEVVEITISREGAWTGPDGPVLLEPGAGMEGIDVVFPALHGPFGEDGVIQGALETVEVPYVGSDVLGSAVCMDKLTLKRLCTARGLPQVEFVEVGDGDWRAEVARFGSPVLVKPSELGSSVGISRVEAPASEELDRAIEVARTHDPRVIVEAHAEGREIEVSVLGDLEPEASLPGEIVSKGDWYDYESKYTEGGMELIAPAELDQAVVERVQSLALEVFGLAGCSGMARCDFFLTDGGEVLVNEVNTIPGFTEMSVYSRLWEASGLPYPELLRKLVDSAIETRRRADQLEY